MVDKHDNPAKKANVPAGVIFCNMVKNVDAITSEPAQFVAVAYEVPIPLTFWGNSSDCCHGTVPIPRA